ncbi:MAG: helix-turn-helix domain-containing protein [Desulfomicrobium sp.]|jgi:DNA-binding XRE family transcriptional regulator|nr:helix-turn-helix domain-containing protein [Desulfomicrobium sp.]
MQALTKKHHTDKIDVARFTGPFEKIVKIRQFADSLGLSDTEDTVDYRNAFPEFAGKESQIAVKAYRLREALTQEQLAGLTGIPRRHLSDMENGRRPIGKENAQKLAKVLNTDYRMFL